MKRLSAASAARFVRPPAGSIFVGGTASHVGKSWFCTAICAWLRRHGFRVAPFKAQNMSNNSYPSIDGGEIGRAQVVQAWACGLEPETAMNPILLKPSGESLCQVVVRGKVWKTVRAREYYQYHDILLEEVLRAWAELATRFDFIVIEGAGSVAEVNLTRYDLVNFGFARRVGAPTLIVADIERGGVFASILGTLHLLEPPDRAMVRSIAINRFRGDPSLFEEGRAFLEQATGLPCLGVFPYDSSIRLEAEDSLSVPPPSGSVPPEARCAIVRLPRISNSTDFELISEAVWIDRPVDHQFDIVILPGSKSTIADLVWLREQDLDRWILAQYAAGARVIGVCGGFQMLGERIEDPHGLDGRPACVHGLALVPAVTVMNPEKQVCRRSAITIEGVRVEGYEIHMGQTILLEQLPPLFTLEDGRTEGVRLERLIGTYLHGALRCPEFLTRVTGLQPSSDPPFERIAESLASWFDRHAPLFRDLYLQDAIQASCHD
ncbi:MAG: cobyric acid synthase [Bryobacterales bacterium]|nr:cobyric acid synthase [Bryobacteraceae bacterium]MDW8356089.1 cobyric acid synthase [Bryobacterales bacterium]